VRKALRHARLAFLLAPALALVACGGGGGGGTKLVAVDQNNAEDVAASSLGAAEFVGSLASLVDDFVDVIEAGSGSYPCPGGGTTTVTVNDVAPGGTISSGDTASIRFIGCIVDFEGEAFTLNGLVDLRVTSATYAGGPAYDILLTATFNNLMFSALGATFTVNGALNVQLETPDGVVFTTVGSGSTLKAAFQLGAVTATNTVSTFRYQQVYDDATGDYSITGYGRVYDSSLGGSFDSEVLNPLEGTDSLGRLKVSFGHIFGSFQAMFSHSGSFCSAR